MLAKVIKYDLLELENLFLKVIKPKEPQPSSLDYFGPSSSFPLSHKKLIYLRVDNESLPYALVGIEEIPQEEPCPSTLAHWEGLYFYQANPL